MVSSQKYKSVSSIVRKNLTELFLFRSYNQSEIDAICEEISGVCNKKDFLEMYRQALQTPYNFI